MAMLSSYLQHLEPKTIVEALTMHILRKTFKQCVDDSRFHFPSKHQVNTFQEIRIRPDRSSHHRCSLRKGVLKKLPKFTGKHLRQNLFYNKSLLKKRLWRKCFSVNFAKFLRKTFLQNTSGRLLLT